MATVAVFTDDAGDAAPERGLLATVMRDREVDRWGSGVMRWLGGRSRDGFASAARAVAVGGVAAAGDDNGRARRMGVVARSCGDGLVGVRCGVLGVGPTDRGRTAAEADTFRRSTMVRVAFAGRTAMEDTRCALPVAVALPFTLLLDGVRASGVGRVTEVPRAADVVPGVRATVPLGVDNAALDADVGRVNAAAAARDRPNASGSTGTRFAISGVVRSCVEGATARDADVVRMEAVAGRVTGVRVALPGV